MLNRQSLAGALATGTHGTGVGFSIMSEQVRGCVGSVGSARIYRSFKHLHLLRLYTSIQLRAVELVTASGEVLRAQKDDPDLALREVSMLWDVFRSLVNPCSL